MAVDIKNVEEDGEEIGTITVEILTQDGEIETFDTLSGTAAIEFVEVEDATINIGESLDGAINYIDVVVHSSDVTADILDGANSKIINLIAKFRFL